MAALRLKKEMMAEVAKDYGKLMKRREGGNLMRRKSDNRV